MSVRQTARYRVLVDDNFHYMDEDERYVYGTYFTPDEALAVCRDIVERWLSAHHKAGMSKEELFDLYTSFGEDPFVRAPTGAPVIAFSAWDYARERAEHLCQGQSS